MAADMSKLMASLDSAVGANSEGAEVTRWINTGSLELNLNLSGRIDGGLPFGRLLEMYGESSTGKTALATEWMINAQKMGGIAAFIDWERSFNQGMAKNMGLNVDRPHFLYFKPRTWEEGNVIATKLAKAIRDSKTISPDAPILVVFDSIASALPQSQAEKEIDTYTMNDTSALSRVTSTTLKAQAQHAEDYDATFLFLNQVRQKIGVVFGNPETTPGGKAMEFYASGRIRLGREKIMQQKDGEKTFVGQRINAEVVKSKFTAPFKKCSMRLSFAEDGQASFDMELALIESLVDKKALTEGTAKRVNWIDGKQYPPKLLAEKIRADGAQAELRKLFESTMK